MCGIVGHLGTYNSLNIVLDGLEALEYRGYDSAGISLIGPDNEIITRKKEGRLKNLRDGTSDMKGSYYVGIGHTRWATHGSVNEVNSHPHCGKGFSVVHNGIIENAGVLKEALTKEGYSFSTGTDTEVFVKLIERELKSNNDIATAILSSFKTIGGNNCIVVLNEADKKIYAIKNNAPLACGQTDDGSNYFVSSDPYALQKYIDTIYFPENEVLCVISAKNEIEFYDIEFKKTNFFKTEKNSLLSTDYQKGEFEHYMLKEIWEQPNLINQYSELCDVEKLEEFLREKPKRISIVACGTAYYAGLFAKNIIESKSQTPVSVDMASEFRYSTLTLKKEDLAIFISQSGETADTLAALQLCKDKGVKTLSILNVAHSTIYRQSDFNLMIHAGPEIGVASTKAFTLQCISSAFLAYAIVNETTAEDKLYFLKHQMTTLSRKIQEVLHRSDEIKRIAEEAHDLSSFFFTGRNKNYAIALEGALKLKEIAYVHAEGYASGELKHGPIAMIDESVLNIAYIDENLYEKTLSNIQEIKTRKGLILSVGKTDTTEIQDISNFLFKLDLEGLGEFSPLALNVFGQLFSYFVAKHKGTDIDKPRNLAKSVTVE